MNRRRFLLGTLAAGTALAGGGAAWLWPEQGFTNPCRAALPPELAQHALVQQCWDGLDPAQVWDVHTHLTGVGDSASGIYLNPAMDRLMNPMQYVQKLFFMNAGCTHDAPGRVDETYVARMRNLVAGMRPGFRMMLFAFDAFYDEQGQRQNEQSSFVVPNAYAQRVAAAAPDAFEWVASIHPYRPDALEQLDWAVRHGARAVKWLPAAQGMDPASPRCDPLYAALARHDLPLITHAGEERAVHGGDTQHLCNPLRLRRPLNAGVRVVVAHCASMGSDIDLDQGPNGPELENFALFARLMDDPRYRGRLFGDLSAVPQINRLPYLPRILLREDWHGRLLHGSDYPLPGVMPLFSVQELATQGLLDAAAVPVLQEVREHNPLLFDFMAKRLVRWQGRSFPAQVFHTRGFFMKDR